MFGWRQTRASREGGAILGSAILVAMLATACTTSAATPSGPVPTSRPTPITPTATATATATPTPSPTPVPTPRAGAALLDDNWTGIRWFSDGKLPPDPAAATPAPATGSSVYKALSISGWSKGYVGFLRTTIGWDDPAKQDEISIVPQSSSDGLSWSAGQPLASLGDVRSIGRVVEGPGGLLAMGYGELATCGGPAVVKGLWISSDGVTWTGEKLPFGKDAIFSIDAGGAGYVAMGEHTTGEAALWTSTDGRKWTPSTPPISSRTGSLQDVTAFAGGFVVVGAVKGPEGCGGPTALTPSVWWSADGKAWTKASLPGVSSAADSWTSVSRISDRELFAVASITDITTETTTDICWVSADGRTWTGVGCTATNFLTNGSRGMVARNADKGRWTFSTFEPDGSIRELAQSGEPLPSADDFSGQFAFGPAGLVLTDLEGSRFFLGVPGN